MSKMDDMRAMREARYARRAAGGDLPTSPARRTPPPGGPAAASAAVAERPDTEHPDAEPQAALCGHKAISGRTCTRERGHDAKSHRYS
jgi:hypothetical protein